jgi:hypothetical protein
MKTKSLLMVAGAGALVYLLWKNNNKGSEIAKENASTKSECEQAGGRWIYGTPASDNTSGIAPQVMVGSCV